MPSLLRLVLRMNGLIRLCPYNFFHACLVINFLFFPHVSIDRAIFFTTVFHCSLVQSFIILATRFCNLDSTGFRPHSRFRNFFLVDYISIIHLFANFLPQAHSFSNGIFTQFSFHNLVSEYYPSASSSTIPFLQYIFPQIYFHILPFIKLLSIDGLMS